MPFPDSIPQTPFFLTSSIPSVESISNDPKKYDQSSSSSPSSLHSIVDLILRKPNRNVRIQRFLSNHRCRIINYGNISFHHLFQQQIPILLTQINQLEIRMKLIHDHYLESTSFDLSFKINLSSVDFFNLIRKSRLHPMMIIFPLFNLYYSLHFDKQTSTYQIFPSLSLSFSNKSSQIDIPSCFI